MSNFTTTIAMQRCVTCIIPDTFPGVTFDDSGICSLCRKFEKQKEHMPSLAKLKTRLDQLINKNRSRNREYDVVVAYSGGKDSTFLVHTLKKKYGLNLLAVTFDNGFMPDHTFANMRTVIDKLGVDHIIYRPKRDLINRIFSASADHQIYPPSLLRNGSSICISCIRMVTHFSLKTALEKRIPMIMIGNSPGQLIQSENEIIYKDNRIPYQLKKSLFEPLASIVGNDVYSYLLLEKDEYKNANFPYIINPLPIIGYDEATIYETISTLGWTRPDDVDPNSSNCQLNSLGIIKHQENFNFHPYDYEMSMLVRLGIISRDEALRRVEDPQGKALQIAESISGSLNIL